MEEGERVWGGRAGDFDAIDFGAGHVGQESLKDELEKHTPPKIIGESTPGVKYADLVLYPTAELFIAVISKKGNCFLYWLMCMSVSLVNCSGDEVRRKSKGCHETKERRSVAVEGL